MDVVNTSAFDDLSIVGFWPVGRLLLICEDTKHKLLAINKVGLFDGEDTINRGYQNYKYIRLYK